MRYDGVPRQGGNRRIFRKRRTALAGICYDRTISRGITKTVEDAKEDASIERSECYHHFRMSIVAECGSFFVAAPPAKKREVERATMAATAGRYAVTEMRHSRSEDLLGAIPSSRSPSPSVGLPATASEDDLIASSALRDVDGCGDADGSGGGGGGDYATTGRPSRPIILSPPRVARVLADRIDPEDSIRDIVTENDLYRLVNSS